LTQGKKIPKENRSFAKSAKLEAQERLGQKIFFGGDTVCIADFFIFNNLMQTTVDPATNAKNPDQELMVFNQWIARMMAIEHVARKNGEFVEMLAPLGNLVKLYPLSVLIIKVFSSQLFSLHFNYFIQDGRILQKLKKDTAKTSFYNFMK
jgi:hypothetical protein